MTRDQLKAEISERIDSIVTENRILDENDVELLVNELGGFVVDIVEANEDEFDEDDESVDEEPAASER